MYCVTELDLRSSKGITMADNTQQTFQTFSTANERETSRSINPKLLEILVCPLTKASLEYDSKAQELISRQARLAYPIRDGIPIMLADEARPLE